MPLEDEEEVKGTVVYIRVGNSYTTEEMIVTLDNPGEQGEQGEQGPQGEPGADGGGSNLPGATLTDVTGDPDALPFTLEWGQTMNHDDGSISSTPAESYTPGRSGRYSLTANVEWYRPGATDQSIKLSIIGSVGSRILAQGQMGASQERGTFCLSTVQDLQEDESVSVQIASLEDLSDIVIGSASFTVWRQATEPSGDPGDPAALPAAYCYRTADQTINPNGNVTYDNIYQVGTEDDPELSDGGMLVGPGIWSVGVIVEVHFGGVGGMTMSVYNSTGSEGCETMIPRYPDSGVGHYLSTSMVMFLPDGGLLKHYIGSAGSMTYKGSSVKRMHAVRLSPLP